MLECHQRYMSDSADMLIRTSAEHVRSLREVEREDIFAALERHNGNRTLTAEQLSRSAPPRCSGS